MPPRAKSAPDAAEDLLGRELPHNLELERSILAVLLDGRHPTAMQQAREHVQHPLHFFHRDHRIIYLACLELDDQGHRVDAPGVAELLSRYDFQLAIEKIKQHEVLLDRDELDRLSPAALRNLIRREAEREAAGYEDSTLAAIGGFGAVAALGSAFAPVAGLGRNLQLLRDYYHKRRFILRLQGITDRAYRTPDNFDRLIEDAGQTVLDLGRMSTTTQLYGIAQTVDDTLDKIAYDQDHPNEGVKTGIPELDQRLMALRPGGLYVLAARPGAGKTSFALTLVEHIAGHPEARNGVLFFSLEVDRLDLVKKLLSATARLDFRSIEKGLLDAGQQDQLIAASEAMKTWDLSLMDVSDLTVSALRAIVKRKQLESKGGLKLIVIDYLQLLNGSRPDMNEYEKVSEISRVLKVLAREMRIPIMALSQMSRDSEKGTGGTPREPRLSDLRGSGTIEQDADAVIFIHRVDQGDGARRDMKIIIAKNRFGPIGACPMHFFPATMRFEASAELHHDPEEAEAHHSRRERLEGQPGEDEDVF